MNESDIKLDFEGHVAIVESCRPPDNYFDAGLIERLADIYEELNADPACRAIVQCSRGKHFCAGFQFNRPPGLSEKTQTTKTEVGTIYEHALRLYRSAKPIVAAVQGAAIGGGLGLALVADFRVTCAEARFSANFSRLGFHHGFGLSLTLPRLVGHNQANLMLFTGRRISGETAVSIGLANQSAAKQDVRKVAIGLAAEISEAAPLAVQAIRKTQRQKLLSELPSAIERELAEQTRLKATLDFKEGINASAQRRTPKFSGE
jgi:enoyl-CoA hydratase/carnithine racemase